MARKGEVPALAVNRGSRELTNTRSHQSYDADRLEPLAKIGRAALGDMRGRYTSLALIDWDTLNTACGLFEDPRALTDPFIALDALSTVITALVFYDRVIVINYSSIVKRADDVGFGDAIVGLPPPGPGEPGGMQPLLDGLLHDAMMSTSPFDGSQTKHSD